VVFLEVFGCGNGPGCWQVRSGVRFGVPGIRSASLRRSLREGSACLPGAEGDALTSSGADAKAAVDTSYLGLPGHRSPSEQVT